MNPQKVEISNAALFDCRVPYLKSLFDSCEYPWEIVLRVSEYAKMLVLNGIEGFSLYSDGVLVGRGVKIAPSATICPPAVIGEDCEIRVGAYIRGGVILGRGVVVGNSSELKNCVMLDGAQAPHYNYVGDSVLGNYSHLGAGAICSNLRSDGRDVVVRADTAIPTRMRKLGAMLGDHVEVGCGCVLNPGTIVGKSSRIYPLTSLRGTVPPKCIVKSATNVVEIK